MKDCIIVFILNILLMFHTQPTTHGGAFLQGVSVAVVYYIVKEIILKIQEDER